MFGFPSLGAFMPPVIKAKKLDEANGLDIEFVERPPDAYTTQFNSGEFKLGGSAALLTVGLADARGIKVKYLFNLFDFWGAVVTSRDGVKSLKDLEGKHLAAARSTTNYVMFEFFAKKMGVDVSKIQVVNTAPPGLVGYAIADRAAAVQLWEPAYTLLKAKKPAIRLLDTEVDKTWKDVRRRQPHSLSRRRRAHRLDRAEPDARSQALRHLQGGRRIHRQEPGRSGGDDRAEVDAGGQGRAGLAHQGERPARHERRVGAADVRKQIEAVYKAGIDVGYLKAQPSGRHHLRKADEMNNRALSASSRRPPACSCWRRSGRSCR